MKIKIHLFKPENVLTDENYYPRICDFGLARCFSKSLTKSMKLTMTGQIGTPLYMAPELFIGEEKYGSSVDVFSFAILAYEIVTGKTPYYELGEKISPIILINKIISGYRPKLDESISDKMKELLEKCWSSNPDEKPSFSNIYEKLSNDFTYFMEDVDEDEIRDFIDLVSSTKKEKDSSIIIADQEREIEKLKQELKDLKQKCTEFEKQLKPDSIHDFMKGIQGILGNKEFDVNINNAIKCFESSSMKGNFYASFILGLLYINIIVD